MLSPFFEHIPMKNYQNIKAIYPMYVQHVEGFNLEFWPNPWSSLLIKQMKGSEGWPSIIRYAWQKNIFLNMNTELKVK